MKYRKSAHAADARDYGAALRGQELLRKFLGMFVDTSPHPDVKVEAG